MKAINTSYKGYLFRSRTEARWAVFFDALGIKWEYEKEGFEMLDGTRYLPDFWLPVLKAVCPTSVTAGHWVEIKGTKPTVEEEHKIERLVKETGHTGFIFVGDPASYTSTKYWCNRKTGEVVRYESEKMDLLNNQAHLDRWSVKARRYYVNTDIEDDDATYPWGERLSESETLRCVVAARSARFEFGSRQHA